MTLDAFNKLLDLLGDDREQAAEEYERLRRKLIIFFSSRGSLPPDELADETINRVARRLSEGVEITRTDLTRYFYEEAKRVGLEYLKSTKTLIDKSPRSEPEHALSPLDQMEREEKRREPEWYWACLEECLQELLPIDREFITAYLRDEGRLKIHHRRELARQLNITTDSLRKSVFKIKSKLKDINTCIATKLMSKVELTDTDISVLTPTIDSALQTLAANQKQINLDRGQTKTLRQEAKTIIFRILETLEPDR